MAHCGSGCDRSLRHIDRWLWTTCGNVSQLILENLPLVYWIKALSALLTDFLSFSKQLRTFPSTLNTRGSMFIIGSRGHWRGRFSVSLWSESEPDSFSSRITLVLLCLGSTSSAGSSSRLRRDAQTLSQLWTQSGRALCPAGPQDLPAPTGPEGLSLSIW